MPVKSFLHNVNASGEATRGKLVLIAILPCQLKQPARRLIVECLNRPQVGRKADRTTKNEMVEPDGVEPTTSCLQSRRSTN